MNSRLRCFARILLVGAAYLAAAKLTLAFAIPPGYATAVWPSSGIALAALLLLGWRAWPGVWVGAALANFSIQYSAPLAAAIATGNTLEALACAVLVRRYVGAHGRFERGEHVVRFVAAVLASCAVAATVAVLSLGAGARMAWGDAFDNWMTWWLGDAAGIIIVAPLLLIWSRDFRNTFSAWRAAECAALAVALVLATLMVFAGWFISPGAHSLTFLLLPLVLWAAFRFTQREVATASALICGIAVWFTVAGRGPFGAESLNRSLLLLQAFVSIVAVTGLALAVVLEERRRVEGRLRRANEELERFVYAAAHDLQEPLRTVVNFADLLARRHRERLDGEGREYLGFIESGVKRMRRLLSDLLSFAQIGGSSGGPPGMDCEAALASVCAGLRTAMEETHAKVTHDPLPKLAVDGTQTEMLFQNLIVNAVKFRSEQPPRIHVSARREPGEWLFSVRDNGIGMDPQYREVIFGIFQRLHGVERYPGTGIGLTICKKIVERHGGRIWVESQQGRGCTFFFTIPDDRGIDA
jgi:signal transduction histidine kinase